jgi:hypothetical protein
LAYLQAHHVYPWLRIEYERSAEYSVGTLGGRKPKCELLLALIFESEGANLSLFGVEDEIFKISFLAESSSNIFEVIWTL